LFETIGSLGIPIFENQNGRIMEADGGASVPDLRIRDGKRQSVSVRMSSRIWTSQISPCSLTRWSLG
jgi:hypothetical protein